ncbi:MAG: Rne/Rng family ribonuclease [Acidimicrobiia bacterium]
MPRSAPRPAAARPIATRPVVDGEPEELPDRPIEGKIQSTEIAERALVRRPQIGDSRPSIGDSRPAPAVAGAPVPASASASGGRGRGSTAAKSGGAKSGGGTNGTPRSNEAKADGVAANDDTAGPTADGEGKTKKRRRGGKGRGSGGVKVVEAVTKSAPVAVDDATRESRRGRERNGKPVGRYLMCVHVSDRFTQIAVLEGRNLIEHYVSRPADDVNQIHGNVYLGKVTNVLPGMEAAFVDIGTPKNAVLYRGDVQYESEDIIERGQDVRIEQMLRNKQTILTQVTKNPIGVKGARLTQEVSLPGRFVVLVPNSKTYGISKRLPDDERKRLRAILDKVKPAQHGVIVRTAAEGVTSEELRRDVQRLLDQWSQIEELAARSQAPKLIYREPSLAVRVIREEFNKDYRGVIIDDRALYEDVRGYVESLNPELADRIRYYDPEAEGLPLFESERVHEQVHKALDRKVWLPSGGSLIIEHTEALTVIDVNTGRNVGSSSLEETVYRNNLEAAEEIARQLRLRDIGGIIVIDFIDMEIRENRRRVIEVFRDALARDKTRTQVFDISDLGLVEMTRKRIGEGLLTAFADFCEVCEGRGVVVHHDRI